MTEYTYLLPIATYSGPQWLVEPRGEWMTAYEAHERIGLVKSEILDTNIRGWDDAEAIIRVTYSNGIECDYLAANR